MGQFIGHGQRRGSSGHRLGLLLVAGGAPTTRVAAQGGGTDFVTPTYVVATLPDRNEPEFLLLLPFTPRGTDNLIGLMAARCDGPAPASPAS